MKPKYITVPVWTDLTREEAWKGRDRSHFLFSVVRWHFVLKERQTGDTPKYGERLAGLDAPAGSGAKFTYRRASEHLDLETSIEQSVQDNELLQTLSTSIRAEATLSPVGALSASHTDELRSTLRSSFSESFQLTRSTKVSEELTTEVNYGKSGANQPLAHVRRFQRYRAVLFLSYADYLVVEYRRQLGLRKRRHKRPAPRENVVKFNIPIIAFEYWNEYGGIHWVNEAEHVNEVPEPYSVEIVDASAEKQGFVDFPKVPSLHRVSNAAFPLKWIKRRGEWTEEELMAIEEKEYVEGGEDRWRWQRKDK